MELRKLLFAAILGLPLLTWSCSKGDSDLDYGEGYVYIGQATMSGGLNNVVTVPYGWGPDTYNFLIEGQTLKVYLSVVRSGKLENETGFSVDVTDSPEIARSAVDEGDIVNAVLLQEGEYTLPTSATVPDGKDFGTFYLEVPLAVLQDQANAGKNLVAGVAISNPTAYTLSETNTSVAVAIDVDAILGHITNE